MGFLIEQVYSGAVIRRSNAFDTAEVLTAAAAVYGGLIMTKKVAIKRLMFVVTTVVASSTQNAVVEFNRRPTIGSATNEVLLGNLTIPNGTAVGTILYKDIDPVIIDAGEELSFEQTVQATDASAATGQGFYSFDCVAMAEVAGNEVHMLKSV